MSAWMASVALCTVSYTFYVYYIIQMLTSMQGMMERTRQAVSLLKERITLTQAELERREVTRDLNNDDQPLHKSDSPSIECIGYLHC